MGSLRLTNACSPATVESAKCVGAGSIEVRIDRPISGRVVPVQHQGTAAVGRPQASQRFRSLRAMRGPVRMRGAPDCRRAQHQESSVVVRRLAVFVDGTWNVASNNTNVWRLHLLTAAADESQTPQEIYYHVGVGTDRTNRIRGAFGKGINASVRNAYEWLLGRYQPDDEIFIFGFSRGAFIARSL